MYLYINVEKSRWRKSIAWLVKKNAARLGNKQMRYHRGYRQYRPFIYPCSRAPPISCHTLLIQFYWFISFVSRVLLSVLLIVGNSRLEALLFCFIFLENLLLHILKLIVFCGGESWRVEDDWRGWLGYILIEKALALLVCHKAIHHWQCGSSQSWHQCVWLSVGSKSGAHSKDMRSKSTAVTSDCNLLG